MAKMSKMDVYTSYFLFLFRYVFLHHPEQKTNSLMLMNQNKQIIN